MQLIFWETCGINDKKEQITPPRYHCLFKCDDEFDLNIKKDLINNYRISTDNKDEFKLEINRKINDVVDSLTSFDKLKI